MTYLHANDKIKYNIYYKIYHNTKIICKKINNFFTYIIKKSFNEKVIAKKNNRNNIKYKCKIFFSKWYSFKNITETKIYNAYFISNN